MPSQFFGLNIAYSGLTASNAALNTTSNNIANVETKGYSRQNAEQAAANVQQQIGSLHIAGTHSGFFSADEEKDIIEDIRSQGTRILLVALGVPKQEKWISEHLYELGPCVCMGVGGTFDVLAGKAGRAPKWMQDNRLEWLYRLLKEPTRFKRMLALPKFVAAVKLGGRAK